MNATGSVLIGIEARAYNATIRNARTRRGLTQQQLADLAGVSIGTVAHLENFRQIRLTKQNTRVLEALGLDESASPEWLGELNLHGVRRVERSVTAELVAEPERLMLSDRSLQSDPFDDICDKTERPNILWALDRLNHRERGIVERRFGIGYPEMTDNQIATEVGMPRGAVSYYYTQGMKKLSEILGT